MPSFFLTFEIKKQESNGTITRYPGVMVNLYKSSDDSLITTLTSDAQGRVKTQEISVAAGTLIYYTCTISAVVYGGSQVTRSTSFVAQTFDDTYPRHDIIVSATPESFVLGSATAKPDHCLVAYRILRDDAPRAWTLLDRFNIGETITLSSNLVKDTDVEISVINVSAHGIWSAPSFDYGVRHVFEQQRETAAPTVTQIGTSTPSTIQIGVTDFTEFARKRRIRISDNSSMTSPTVIEYDSGDQLMPRFVDVMRNPTLQAAFTWTGNNPASNGFTKVGSGTTAVDGDGWKITTTGDDAATNYTKNSFPASPFTNGFTLEIQPPTVASTEGDLAVAVRVDNGTKKYELTFSSTQVKLNGGTAHTHSSARVRLVINAGGNTADLWIGTTKAEDETAGATGSANGLTFGDLATTDDSEATWSFLAYAVTPQEPLLAQTIWVRVSHSAGNNWSAESVAQSFTFANESGTGGSVGATEDPLYFWKQEVDIGVL